MGLLMNILQVAEPRGALAAGRVIAKSMTNAWQCTTQGKASHHHAAALVC
jgi:hypothetical protein